MRTLNRSSVQAIIPVTAILIVVLDQLVKSATIVVFNSTGWMGLGIPANFQLIAYAIALVLAFYGYLVQHKFAFMLLTLVILATGNLYDRLVFGGVRDYLQLAGVWFNLADVAITGVIITCLFYLLYTHRAY